MGVALISWGRFFDSSGKAITVPAPPSEPAAPWFWDFLASNALALRNVGFSAVQLPPCSKAWGGTTPTTDGYGLFDSRDIGSKNQQGSINTRYGSAQSLRRLVALCHAVDLDVYLDIVLHQLDGENGGPGVFTYVGSDGTTMNGRGPMSPGCFVGIPPANLQEDAVPDPGQAPDGREKVYQNSTPPDYTISDSLDFGDWIFRTTGADGMRCDDAKSIWAQFVKQFMTTNSMAKKFAFAEYWDGNVNTISSWVYSNPMSSRSLVIDFPLHYALQDACDNGNVYGLNGAGFAAESPYLSCTFVENPDTDVTPNQSILTSKLLAYAFMLTTEGYPFVFSKDYFGPEVWPGAYGLKPFIDNLIWIHETLASGSTMTEYLDQTVIVLYRTGGPGLLSALNFDTWNQRTITCSTGFGPNVQLHDYTGRSPDTWTDSNGNATFTIPSNAYSNGQSYLCFSVTGITVPIQIVPRSTTQVFFGAVDLDIPPVTSGSTAVATLWFAQQSPVTLSLSVDTSAAAWPLDATIEIQVVNSASAGVAASLNVVGSTSATPVVLNFNATDEGWYEIRFVSANLPQFGYPFAFTCTYMCSQTLP